MKKVLLVALCCFQLWAAFASQDKKQINFNISAANGMGDYTQINFDQTFTAAYVQAEDVEKVFSASMIVPAVYSYTSDNHPCLINSFSDLQHDEEVAIGVKIDTDGTYTFSASAISNFPAMVLIRLEDRATGIFQNLRSGPYTTFLNAGTAATGRFFLHFSATPTYTLTAADCLNAHGACVVSYDPGVTWQKLILQDTVSGISQVKTNVSGVANFNQLQKGIYKVFYQLDSAFVLSDVITVPGNAVLADVTETAITANVNEELQFHATIQNAQNYDWSISDGTIISGVVNPYYFFGAEGAYTVTLHATNDAGCAATDVVQVQVLAPLSVDNTASDNISVYANGSTIYLNVPGAITQPWSVKVFSILGEEVANNVLTGATSKLELNVPSSYYIVTLMHKGKVERTQKVALSAQR